MDTEIKANNSFKLLLLFFFFTARLYKPFMVSSILQKLSNGLSVK